MTRIDTSESGLDGLFTEIIPRQEARRNGNFWIAWFPLNLQFRFDYISTDDRTLLSFTSESYRCSLSTLYRKINFYRKMEKWDIKNK